MQHDGDAFRSGKYHKSFKRNNAYLIRSIALRIFYTTSAHLLKRLDWPNPLVGKTAPHVLLCGSASPATTLTFARFVRRCNNTARLAVLDISPSVLSQSAHFLKSCRDIDAARISFVEGDALHMPFADECFDWIETDFLIQFFSAQEKALLFQEWYRVLKPGGVITTRDWLMEGQDGVERVVAWAKNWCIRHILGPVTYDTCVEDVQKALGKPGFTSAIFPMRVPGIGLRIPVIHYLLIYKPPVQEHMPPVHA